MAILKLILKLYLRSAIMWTSLIQLASLRLLSIVLLVHFVNCNYMDCFIWISNIVNLRKATFPPTFFFVFPTVVTRVMCDIADHRAASDCISVRSAFITNELKLLPSIYYVLVILIFNIPYFTNVARWHYILYMYMIIQLFNKST